LNETTKKWIIKTASGYYFTVGSRSRRYGRFTASRAGAEAVTQETAKQMVELLEEMEMQPEIEEA
jgi:hypothetical protein